jgi:pyruvate ferredoxin oxidoreductase delta subunit
MAKHNDIVTNLYKSSDQFEDSIWDKGWDELIPGVAIYPFNKNIEHTVVNVYPEDRDIAQTSSVNKYVGDWRVKKPVWNENLCIDCQNCWIYCPDTSIISRNKQMVGIDYDHCKGCGICSEVCPTNPKSIVMFDEQIKNEDALNQWPKKSKKGE